MDDAMAESRNEGYRRAKLNAKKMESNGRNVVGGRVAQTRSECVAVRLG
jgi:hypothetical protein